MCPNIDLTWFVSEKVALNFFSVLFFVETAFVSVLFFVQKALVSGELFSALFFLQTAFVSVELL